MVHFPATIAMLVWAFCRHRAAYGRIRAAFLGVTLAALVIHVLVPLAPPRMLAGEGFVDTLQVYGPRIYPTDTTQSVANQFAALEVPIGEPGVIRVDALLSTEAQRDVVLKALQAAGA